MTYMGVCDLFLPVDDVSVSTLLWTSGDRPNVAGSDITKSSAIIGATLERQAEGLMPSKWKPVVRTVINQLLQRALHIYEAKRMPIRRARVILRLLALDAAEDGELSNLAELKDRALEAEALLQAEVRNHLF